MSSGCASTITKQHTANQPSNICERLSRSIVEHSLKRQARFRSRLLPVLWRSSSMMQWSRHGESRN
ncbi:hypothetical protein B0O80DRAFT_460615, partial [Mortierella sp. GBAus27b]